MNQFLKDSFLTLAIGIVTFALIDIFIPLPQNDYSAKQEYIETHVNDIKIPVPFNHFFQSSTYEE